MPYKSFLKVFLSILFLHLATLYVNDNERLIAFSKILIVGSLIVWWHSQKGFSHPLFRIYAMGLVLCLIGDILLLNSQLFLTGLGSFLIAQLLYAFVFYKILRSLESKKKGLILGLSVSLLLFALLIYPRIQLVSSELRIPIVVYSICILTMFALSIALAVSDSKNWKWLALGSFLFVLSDGLLAWSMFLTDFPYDTIAVMASYGLAQLVIMRSLNLSMNEA